MAEVCEEKTFEAEIQFYISLRLMMIIIGDYSAVYFLKLILSFFSGWCFQTNCVVQQTVQLTPR